MKIEDKKPNVLHLLNRSLPLLSGYSIRSHNILTHQKTFVNSFAITDSDFLLKNDYDIIDNVIYYRCPKTVGSRLFYEPSIFKKMKVSRIYRRYYRTILNTPKNMIEKIVKNKHIDLIHGHTPQGFAKKGEKVARKFEIPFIYEVRGFWEDTQVALGYLEEESKNYMKIRKKETALMTKADTIITLGKAMEKDIRNRGINEKAIKIIPNAVDTEKFKPKSPNTHLQEQLGIKNKKVIGYIGSIRKIEGIEYLIEAMKFIKKEIPNTFLLLVGPCSIDYKNELLKEIKKLKLEGYVQFSGSIQPEHIQDYYSIIDIHVIPRINVRVNRLVTPLKPLEIMAMGKVVISSDLLALRELIEPDVSGDLFRSENSENLAEKVCYYLSENEKKAQLETRARDYVVKNYDWNVIIQKYKQIYDINLNKKI